MALYLLFNIIDIFTPIAVDSVFRGYFLLAAVPVIIFLLVQFSVKRFSHLGNEKARLFVSSIGALLSFSVIFIFIFMLSNNTRGHPSWARVPADVRQLQTALELYYNDVGLYPETGAVFGEGTKYCLTKEGGFTETSCSNDTGVYMSKVIPGRQGKDKSDNCPAYIDYTYIPGSDRMSYELKYCLEETASPELKAGFHTVGPERIDKN